MGSMAEVEEPGGSKSPGFSLAVAWGEFVRTGLIRTWPQDEAFICYRAFCAGFEAASRKPNISSPS